MNHEDFPILKRIINGKPLVYLDNAATSQMPKQVMDAIVDFEFNHRANVHRGAHTLSGEATDMYENARKKIAEFIHAVVPQEIVFVKNSTEAVNTIAFSWARNNLHEGDVILVSKAEHHSNLVPWQMAAKDTGAVLVDIPLDENGLYDFKKVSVDWKKVRLVAINHVSNIFGSINDVKEISKYIKRRVAEANQASKKEIEGLMPRIFLDASQSIPHFEVNVQKLGVDFMGFSGHKMCGPMGIGVLWVNRECFSQLRPFNTGGGMIRVVEHEKSTFTNIPEMFEAGTPNVSGAIGLAAAIDYLKSVGMENIFAHDKVLAKYALEQLLKRDDIEIYGSKNPEEKTGVITFNMKNISAHDVAVILDSEGVAVRSGHHCVMPWHMEQNQTTSVRMSLYFYNTQEDVDVFIKALDKVKIIVGSR